MIEDMISRRQIFGRALAVAGAIRVLRAQDERVPAHHEGAPKGPLPDTKDPALYANQPIVKRVYELAGKIKPVLYQQPCFCNCDKFAGHGSLLDCFVDSHGEECGVCQREAVFAYVQTKAHKTPKQIRAAIIAGEWRNVDMSPSALMAL